MEFITKNLKKVGVVNIILIVAVLVARCITFANSPAMSKVESIIGTIGLVFGLIYAFNEYKKDAAKYYKLFMYTYVINSIIYVIRTIVTSQIWQFVLGAIVLICMCLLAFVKDFGKTKSFTAIGIVLLTNVIRFVAAFFATNVVNVTSLVSFSSVNLTLAIIAFIFVVCKYADKESRGTK